MDPLEILARLYAMLSECTSTDLRRAAHAVPPRSKLHRALLMLSQYRATVRGQREVDSETGSRGTSGMRSMQPQSDAVREAVAKIAQSKHFESTKRLVAHLNSASIGVRFSTKDGRQRILSKLTRLIQDAETPRERASLLRRISAGVPSDETANWFRAILENN